jgi:hypothetical protein
MALPSSFGQAAGWIYTGCLLELKHLHEIPSRNKRLLVQIFCHLETHTAFFRRIMIGEEGIDFAGWNGE